MKRILTTLLATAGLVTTAMAVIPPQGYKGLDHPERQLQAFVERARFEAKNASSINTLSYGNGVGADGIHRYGVTSPTSIGSVRTIGSVHLPVIMVEFTDVQFKDFSTIDKVSRQFNEEGYSDVDYAVGTTRYPANGSVRDYFHAMSRGLFDPSFDVLGKIRLPHAQEYYFADKDGNRDNNVGIFLQDAMAAAQTAGMDFTPFIRDDNKGRLSAKVTGVPLVIFMCAGYSEAEVGFNLAYYGKDTKGYSQPWPHFSRVYSSDYTDYGRVLSGVKVMGYFIGCELHGDIAWVSDTELEVRNTCFAGTGTFIHEFGHALGLPDIYCTDGSVEEGTPCMWSVMDSGPYLNKGYNPIGYTAYERNLCGWLEIPELGNNPAHVTLYGEDAYGQPDTPEDAAYAYVIKSPNQAKEYYILENRRADGLYYPTKMGNGMLVHHVYYNYNSWEGNTLNNNASMLRYTVVPADGKWQRDISGNNYKNDLFPGVTNTYTSLTDTSTPQAATLYTGTKLLGHPIYNIKKEGSLITFDYMQKDLTGIHSAETLSPLAPQSTYDLQGRPVNETTRGIYLQGGHKYIR